MKYFVKENGNKRKWFINYSIFWLSAFLTRGLKSFTYILICISYLHLGYLSAEIVNTLGEDTYEIRRNKSKNYYHQGYLYRLDKERKKRSYYHCIYRKTLGCTARLIFINLDDGQIKFIEIKNHNHPAKASEAEYEGKL